MKSRSAGPTRGKAKASAPQSHSSPPRRTRTKHAERAPFVVGIGASAGGLQALQEFFGALHERVGAAFVVVQHLSPDFKSFMVELLAKHTAMRVQRAEHGAAVVPGNVYLIPPKMTLTINGGCLHLDPTDPREGLHLPIDQFFLSLAQDQQQRAVAIVLSGTGSDGTAGVRAVKDAGGMVMVQTEESAQFDGMPRSAISTGLADYVLAPEKMAAQLVAYLKHPALAKARALNGRRPHRTQVLLDEIFALLRTHCGVDFSHYKPATIDRRIERRMSVTQIPSMADYARHLAQSPRETSLLFNELLIGVTSYFRDRPAWEMLGKEVVPALLRTVSPSETFRAWVAGCSTGEEAYSLAMLIAEQMEKLKIHRPVKIFATDIAKDALATATRGYYSPSEVAGLSPARLQQFFVPESSGFRVKARLREMVVFANHNLLSDPPFTRLNFISCRNLLIYLQPQMQQRVLTLFSFALREGGILFLGGSESIGDATDRFQPVATRANLYRNRRISPPPPPITAGASRVVRLPRETATTLQRTAARLTAGETPSVEEIHRHIVEEFTPACLVIDNRDEVLHVIGTAGDYLKHPPGGFTRNVFKLTGHNFANALRSALIRAQQKNDTFTYDHVRFKSGRKSQVVRLHVRPLPDKQGKPTGFRLVHIEPRPDTSAHVVARLRSSSQDIKSSVRIGELERDLSLTRESLQATVQDLETSNEEIQAANEELLAANEELQSTNEELQSVNEELHTVNAENQSRIEELTHLTNDINNLLATAAVAVLLVDNQLRIRRASRSALLALDLTEADLGVPIETIARILHMPDLPTVAQRVIRSAKPEEREIERVGSGRWLLVRCVPFRNESGQIQGVVLTLIDLTERHESEKRILAQAAVTQSVLDAIDACLAVVDRDGQVLYVNEAWRTSKLTGPAPAPSELPVGSNYLDSCDTAERDGVPAAREALAGIRRVLRSEAENFSYDYQVAAPTGLRWYRLHVVPLHRPEGGLVIAHFNITPMKAAETLLARS
ncbi:MAG TPA: chemotaxis protein CheB [Opitutaceae bacterium]|nr:chemotaxis protein CheB [Opitutaceae bacterium]